MKKGNSKKKPVAPIYTIALIFMLVSVAHPISSFGRLLLTALLAAMGYSVVRAIVGTGSKKETTSAHTTDQAATARQQAAKPEEAPKAAEKPQYPPEVQAVVDEGAKAQAELRRLYATIPDLTVKRKVQEIMDISDKIIRDAVEDPSDVPQIKKFLDYYLPTTIKLLNAYDRMGAQGIEGENITNTMRNINDMLDTAITAYKRLLDGLFANQAMDIETDIQVMNTLLQREGLTGNAGFGSK